MTDEGSYDRLRIGQWLAGQARGDGLSRRHLMRLAGGVGLAAVPALGGAPARALAVSAALAGDAPLDGAPASAALPAAAPIVKPLPPELFYVYGTNAEMRWEAMRGQGYLVPIDRFFVRNHTLTPLLDADTWRLRLFGTGLRGAPAEPPGARPNNASASSGVSAAEPPGARPNNASASSGVWAPEPPGARPNNASAGSGVSAAPDNAIELSYADLRAMPSTTLTAFVECAGNGRSFYTTQQQQSVTGTAWKLGAIGVARWRGVRLSTVLRRAGLKSTAVDILPAGLDPDFVSGGVNLGPVRRPIPVRKALHDVILAYEMNGEPLPPDHGFPVRLIVPSWIGISSIKWLGQIEVSDSPLFSPWNTQFYRLFGPGYPADGTVIGEQVSKSAFELPWDAQFAVGHSQLLYGRSWSGHGRIRKVEVSVDGGETWRRARLLGPDAGRAWQRWEFPWRPDRPGPRTLLARATDITGAAQPDVAPYNTLGYLFGGVVRHPVTVV